MRNNLTKIAHILFILVIGAAITSCSSDDKDDGGGASSSSGGNGNNSSPSDNSGWWERYQESLKYYDPADKNQRCNNGVTEFKCDVNGGTWYNPLEYECFTCTMDGCSSELFTLAFCGNEIYYLQSSYERCQDGVFQMKCEDVWYNRETQYCAYVYDNGTQTRTVKANLFCGGKYYEYERGKSYDPDGVRCNNGVIEERCWEDATWYNPDTYYCDWNEGTKARVRCGNRYITPDFQRCNNGVVELRCDILLLGDNANASWYNEITQSCDWQTGEVRDKVRCGS